MTRLEQFVEALTILNRCIPDAMTGAEHDEFYVYGKEADYDKVCEVDRKRLNELGFEWDDEVCGWRRYT